MSDKKNVAISIVNYNSKDLLNKLLKNILAQKINNLEIWVIDNNSPDNGVQMIKDEFKSVYLIESEENGGFAKGHNLALKKIKTDYILILNPDTYIPNGAIESMIKFMEDNPQCGISSCKIIGTNKSLHSNGGDLPFGLPLLVWLFNLEMFGGVNQSLGNFHREDKEYYENAHEVGWVGGTFMFLRREVLEEVGFLPEEYFMYFEDADFCFEAQKKGFKIMINPEVIIEHTSGASSKDPKFSQFKGEAIGLETFYQKHYGEFSKMSIRLLLFMSTFARILAFSIVGRNDLARTYWKVLSYV